MKILITYSSVTGNTKKVAKAIAEELKDCDFLDIKDVKNLDYDIIIVGTWIRRTTADPKAMEFIDKIKGKKVAFFFTLGAYPNSEYADRCIKNITELFLKNNNILLGNFHCHGAVSPSVIARAMKRSQDDPHGSIEKRMERWKHASTHPDENDLSNAKKYFKEMVGR